MLILKNRDVSTEGYTPLKTRGYQPQKNNTASVSGNGYQPTASHTQTVKKEPPRSR